MMKTTKKGFTLAEVLTTLMVIGVVAAMTIPTLMNSTSDQQYKVAYKKALSVLSQGIQLMIAKEEECKVQNSHDLAACMNKVISGTITNEEGKVSSDEANMNVITTSDGMAYAFYYTRGVDSDSSDIPEDSSYDTYRSLDYICGDSFGNDEEDYNGEKSSCLVVVDVNGTSKGQKAFATQSNTIAGKKVSSTIVKGTDQLAISLTGAGVRPIYVKGDSGILNNGYHYMYGEKASPFSSSSAAEEP
ncbi:MAG: type II secretion system GspH family protein [bacterium]|nr:type II secretion system GspH family protein [bacterium]